MMEFLGFILGGAALVYLSAGCLAMPYVSALGGGLKGWGTFWWLVGCCVVLSLWWLLFSNAPFSITVAT
jgi:hypothetical protein